MSYFITFLQVLCEVLVLAVFARAILSWFSVGPGNILMNILYQITEPVLTPLRRIIPRTGVVDWSPLIAIILLQLISYLLYLIP